MAVREDGMVAAPLLARGRTRAGWAAIGALCLGFAAAAAWVTAVGTMRFPGHLIAGGMAAGYLWLGLAAVDLARSVGVLRIGGDRVVVEHPGLLAAPIVIPREQLAAVAVDPRSRDERRIAAAARRRVIAPASFLDASIPVVGSAPSTHSASGTAVVPNLVLFLHEPVTAPAVPRGARLLLKLSGGRTGRYRGPRPGKPVRALRLCVEDAALLAHLGEATPSDRDRPYLAPIRERDRRRAARDRLITAAIVVGAGVVIPLLVWLGDRSA